MGGPNENAWKRCATRSGRVDREKHCGDFTESEVGETDVRHKHRMSKWEPDSHWGLPAEARACLKKGCECVDKCCYGLRKPKPQKARTTK